MTPTAKAVYAGLRQIGRIEPASAGNAVMAFAADGKRLGKFPNEAVAMRAITDSAKAKERRRGARCAPMLTRLAGSSAAFWCFSRGQIIPRKITRARCV